MIYVNIENKKFYKEISYVFDLMFSSLGLTYSYKYEDADKDDILITYGYKRKENKINQLFIKESSALFNDKYLKEMPKIKINRYRLDKPIKYIDHLVTVLDEEVYGQISPKEIQVDLISNIFFLVTRYEEYIIKEKDCHERFLPEEAVLVKNNLINRPLINEYFEYIFQCLKNIDARLEKKNYFQDKDYAICISHDIDTIFKYKDKFIRGLLVKLIKERNLKEVYSKIKNYCKVLFNKDIDPFWTFNYLITLEKKYNFTASYYFMSGGNSKNDNQYNINNPNLRLIFDEIKANGSEIGIHGSYNSYNNSTQLGNEINKLKKYSSVQGIRQHYLRFSIPDTWEIQEENNLKYDTTLGFAQIAGFRGGICVPYKPFNLNKKKVIDIWEIPLIVMDGTLLENQYMGLNKESAIEYVKELMNKINQLNGVFALLWHNSSLDNTGYSNGWDKVYEEILSYANKTNALGVSGINLIHMIEERGREI